MGSGFSLQFSRHAEQSLLYLIDGTNQRVWVLGGRTWPFSIASANPDDKPASSSART